MGEGLVNRREVEKLLVLTGALESGVIDALAEAEGGPPEVGVPADEVARRAGTDDRATTIILEALVDLDVLEALPAEEAEASSGEIRYRLTPDARRRLLGTGPEVERNSLLHQASKVRGWLELPYVLEHGRPKPRERTESGRRSFVRTMAEGDPEVMEEVVEEVLAYARESAAARPAEDAGPRDLLDVGGAVGHMAVRYAAHGLRATLCDRAEVLEEAAEYQGRRIEEVELSPCDFTAELPSGPFDIVYLGNVYHIYGPDTNRSLTRRVHDRLRPGGTIAIRDFVHGRSPRAPLFAVNMLQATEEGGVWSEEQYRGWLEDAGLVGVEIMDLDRSDNQLILGRRP